MKLGHFIKSYREKEGLTQQELSLKLGYTTNQFVHLMEVNKSLTPLPILGKLFMIFKISERMQNSMLEMIVDDFRRAAREKILEGKSSIKN